jgi:hypothetical protein
MAEKIKKRKQWQRNGRDLQIKLVDACCGCSDPERRAATKAKQIANGEVVRIWDVSKVKDAGEFDRAMEGRTGSDAHDFAASKFATFKDQKLRGRDVFAVGVWCTGDLDDVPLILAQAHIPLIVAGKNPAFSDRKKFPYFWRVTNSLAKQLEDFGRITKMLGPNISKVAIYVQANYSEDFVPPMKGALRDNKLQAIGELFGTTGVNALVTSANRGLQAWKDAKLMAEKFAADPTRIIWNLATSCNLFFVSALLVRHCSKGL